MSQRRKFNSQFKFKVVVEALSERLPLHELAKKHDLHPNQITTWKKERFSVRKRLRKRKKKMWNRFTK